MDNQILEQLQKARRIALFNVLKDANPIQKYGLKDGYVMI